VKRGRKRTLARKGKGALQRRQASDRIIAVPLAEAVCETKVCELSSGRGEEIEKGQEENAQKARKRAKYWIAL
jgi:hypothetical protein